MSSLNSTLQQAKRFLSNRFMMQFNGFALLSNERLCFLFNVSPTLFDYHATGLPYPGTDFFLIIGQIFFFDIPSPLRHGTHSRGLISLSGLREQFHFNRSIDERLF